MSNVIPLVRKEAVDAAWDRFQAQSSKLIDDRNLLRDRAFMEELARRERSWKHLFWAGDCR